jgi:hypothetical protein
MPLSDTQLHLWRQEVAVQFGQGVFLGYYIALAGQQEPTNL